MGEQPQADSAATLDAFIAAALPHPQPANIAAINVCSCTPFILELNSPITADGMSLSTLVGKFSAMHHHVDGMAAFLLLLGGQLICHALSNLQLCFRGDPQQCPYSACHAATAHAIWAAVEGLFYDNKTSCALVLEVEFWTTEKGDQMVFLYSGQISHYYWPTRLP